VTAPARQPDPSKGVFESMLVVNGEPVELDAHLARLRRSLDEIYGADLPAAAREELVAAAADISLGRIRLTVVPGKDRLRHDLFAGGVEPGAVFPERGAELCSHQVKGGHGCHKWVDRGGMEHPEAGPGQLIRDGDELLEAGWANLFAVREETLWTPPADGRILPGTARAALLEIATKEALEIREEPLTHEDLLAADEVFLTNSVRGIEPAIALDGAPLAGSGPVSRRLAAALRRRWNLPDAAGDPATPAAAPTPDRLSH
jgi:para-aminobenzoate synthetase/4-amino-4-deoxychorismate lyase